MKTQQRRKPKDSGTTEYSRNRSEERYIGLRAKEHRKKVTRIAIIAGIAAVVCAIFIGAAVYASTLNSRMTTKDEDLLSSLKQNASDEPFYMLLLGVDKGEERFEDEEYGEGDENYRADSIMLCRIDPKNVRATLMSIHRDLVVTLPDGTEGKINSAFSQKGPAGMVQTVSKLADVDISHYAEIDFDSFMKIVDSIGGVEVTLPVAVRDPEYTKLDLDAGTHTLNGHDALMLCRSRHAYDDYGDGDVYRAANQRAVIGAIIKKVLKSDPATMISAISSMADSVTTDMSVDQILALAAQMRDFDTERDMYTGMTPTESEYEDDTYYEVLDETAWKAMMKRVDKGLSPYEKDESDDTQGIAGNTSGNTTPSDKAKEKTSSSKKSDSSDDSDSSEDSDSSDSSKKSDSSSKSDSSELSSSDKDKSDSSSTSGSSSKSDSSESSSSDRDKSDSSSTSGSSSTNLKSVSKDGTVSVIGVPGGSATVIASDLDDQGFSTAAYENASFVSQGNVVVYGDSQHKAEAEALAKYLGDDFVAVENDGSYYLASEIVVWVAD